jgi:NADP-dependent 3-hydroxy acid dehydrogenase YdfG
VSTSPPPVGSLLDLSGHVAVVTGAGGTIGAGIAMRLHEAGASVVFHARDRAALEPLPDSRAAVATGDVVRDAQAICSAAVDAFGRLDVLVNNAGTNIPNRNWQQLDPEGIDTVLAGNLTSAFYVVQAALPIMRAQKDGVMIHTASWAGRHIGPISGPAYTAAKHGMVAMSHTINLEEGMNGIRSSVLCPGEVATPILLNRPIPETPEIMARMIQPQDMGALIAFIARQPAHVCINEVLITPTHNRGYIGIMQARAAALAGKR